MSIYSQISQQKRNKRIGRVGYGLMLIISCMAAFYWKDYAGCMCALGLALVFDPFDATLPFVDRPLFQKMWLIMHLTLVYILLIYLLLTFN
jgi:hypothetical protein